MKNVLITICGRAGSKGCKNKNLKDFLDKPLVYYTLAAAFDFKSRVENANVDICLNTDSVELSEIVKRKYPEVVYIERNKDLGEDLVPKAAVWHNSYDVMCNQNGINYDLLIDLDITSPLRQKDDILNAYKLKLERPDADMVESVCQARRNPYFNMYKDEGKQFVSKVLKSNFTTRQEAPVIYDENASIYVLETRFFKNNTENMLNTANTIIYEMKDTAVVDIDSEEDFELMGVIAKYLYDKQPSFKYIKNLIR